MKIIYDPGSTHNGSLKYAHELIDVVKESGADSIKWQLFLGSKNGNIELPRKWWAELLKHAQSIDLDMFASVFDENAIDLLHSSGITKIKLAYSQNFNLRLIRKARKLGMQIWASGNSCMPPIYADVMFYCAPYYPVKFAIEEYLSPKEITASKIPGFEGLSSHWLGIKSDVANIKKYGFEYLEKHITLFDHDDINVPDHWFALLPNEAKEMCNALKEKK